MYGLDYEYALWHELFTQCAEKRSEFFFKKREVADDTIENAFRQKRFGVKLLVTHVQIVACTFPGSCEEFDAGVDSHYVISPATQFMS